MAKEERLKNHSDRLKGGSISFLVGESDSPSPQPSPDFGRGGMPLIPSSPQGISRDGTCLPGFGSGGVDSATEASTHP